MRKTLSRLAPIISSIIIIASLVAIYLYAKSQGIDVLEPAGYISSHQRDLFWIAVALGAVALIPVFFMTYAVVHRYHDKNPKSTRRFDRYFQIKPEASVFWSIFISVIILVLAVIMISSTIGVDPYKPIQGHGPSKTIRVVALPWKWLFIYPDERVATVNELTIPVGQPISFELTADAPMSSFWIPKLGGMIYTMEGMVTNINLMATSPGQFEGKNAEINGIGYSGMMFTVNALPQDQYQQWVAQTQSGTKALDKQAYHQLAKDSINHPVQHYAQADPSLFGYILSQFTSGHHHALEQQSQSNPSDQHSNDSHQHSSQPNHHHSDHSHSNHSHSDHH